MIKKNFKFLKTCSFKFVAENSEYILDGRIIYVADSCGVIFPYFCPEKMLISVKECEYKEETTEEADPTILEELSEMPTYIVHELLSKYKDKPSFYRVIKKELVSRGIYENKKYKLRKEILEIELEESDFDDKYQRRREIKYKKS